MGGTVDVSTDRWDKHQTEIGSVEILGTESASTAINGKGRGLVQLWLGPFTGTKLTILHSPSRDSVEPDAGTFVALEDDAGPIELDLPPEAAAAGVCIPVSTQQFHTMFWFKLVSDVAEGDDRTINMTMRFFS